MGGVGGDPRELGIVGLISARLILLLLKFALTLVVVVAEVIAGKVVLEDETPEVSCGVVLLTERGGSMLSGNGDMHGFLAGGALLSFWF